MNAIPKSAFRSIPLGLLALAMPACATPQQAATETTPQRHRLVAEALRDGERAEMHPAESAQNLADAASRLQRIGAAPLPGTEDLAVRWQREATEHGAKPAARPPMRGRALGAAYRRDRLGANAESITRQVFLAGTRAVVTVVPSDDADLQLQVSRDGEAPACAREVDSPHATCEWIPSFTQRYTIRVSNAGSSQAEYFLIIN